MILNRTFQKNSPRRLKSLEIVAETDADRIELARFYSLLRKNHVATLTIPTTPVIQITPEPKK